MRHSSMLLVPAVLLSIGCTTVQNSFTDQLSASGVGVVSADMDSGSLHYNGMSTDSFTIDGRSWGMATKAERAEERLESESREG